VSGIRWRERLIVTAAEAIGGAAQASVRLGSEDINAEVLASDLGTDIAVLQIASVPEGSERNDPASAKANLHVGETIAVVGRTARGVAALWGSVRLAGPAWSSRRGGRIDQRIELDVGFDAALEGAAVVDTDGRIAAMAVPGPGRSVLGIPAETIETVVAKVERFGHLPQPYIGVRLQPLWLDEGTRERLSRKSRTIAAVGGVDSGSPAAAAQIELGDLLMTLDGHSVESVTDLAQAIAGSQPGQMISLEVLRGGKPLTISVKVGERPRQ
jgi:S1-C subfamily serine protease